MNLTIRDSNYPYGKTRSYVTIVLKRTPYDKTPKNFTIKFERTIHKTQNTLTVRLGRTLL